MTPEEIDLISSMTDTASGREKLIESISTDHPDNWQNVSTPYDIVREMCDLVPSDATHFCVLFSMEFLEVLVKERNIPPENVLFFGDNELEVDMAGSPKMYGVHTRILSKNVVAGNGFDSSILAQLLQEGVDAMKFSKLAVMMNPPYQINNDKGGSEKHASPLYHRFIEVIIDDLSPNYLVSINPSRWMVGGRGLKKFRLRMMKDCRIRKIVHFPNPREVFTSVGIAGGVNYFLWDKDHDGSCDFVVGNSSNKRYLGEFNEIILQDNQALEILRRVIVETSTWMNKAWAIQTPFGLISSFKDWKKSGVPCYCRGKNVNFCDASKFEDKHNIMKKWKVCTGKATSEGNITKDKNGKLRVLSNLLLIEPNAICTQTYIVVNIFDSKKEAENFITYMKTKFFRFMLGLRISGIDVNKEKFAWVPDVEDYSTAWTDKELYDKFGLTRQERAYIESKIKELK